MARSTVELQKIISAQGRSAGEMYCKDWQRELTGEGNRLMSLFKTQKIDTKTYNMTRADLNKQQQELNSCVATLNKR